MSIPPTQYSNLIQYNNHGKNLVIAGRHKDGYPNYLVGPEFIDMRHQVPIDISSTGVVRASSERASYEKTIPLKTQMGTTNTYPWISVNNVVTGWWEYTFTDPNRSAPVLVGLYLNGVHDNQPTFSPKKWQLLGWNETSATWDIIYKEDNDPQFRGWLKSDKDYGRMYWFTDNITSYKKIRINIDSNHGGSYIGAYTIKFYEQVVPKQHKYDTSLYASSEEPFIATVSCGLNDDGTQIVDKLLRITEPVTYSGNMLAECTRNYMYIVPQSKDGIFPKNLDKSRTVEIQQNNTDQRFYLYSDHRKIHYGTLRDIEIECTGLLQSNSDATGEYPINVDKWIEHDRSLYRFPLRFYRTGITSQYSHRGSSGSYDMSSTSTTFIAPDVDTAPAAYFPNRNSRMNNNCCTIEVDVKWSGPKSEASGIDDNRIIFDAGWYTNLGFSLVYNNFCKALNIHWGSASINNYIYSAPCNLDDNAWHTVSLAIDYDKLYLHVDGLCVGIFDNVEQHRFNYNYWMLGRWIHKDSDAFIGYLNNFRYTLGTCLYCSKDYEVSSKFNTSLIPDKTLWFDENAQVVKEYQATTHTWLDTPMLPIGCVETGRREHLLTDNPRGTHHLNQMKYIDDTEWNQSASYDGSHVAKSMFNFGHNNHSYGYHTPNNNTTVEHWIQFGLYKPMSFDRLYICLSNSNKLQGVHKFKLLGSNDKSEWTTLIDNSTNYVPTAFECRGALPEPFTALQAYKSYTYDDPTLYKYYKIVLPPKSDIPAAYRNNYTCLKTLFFFKDSKPEVLKRTSVMCGHKWTYGPICMLNNEFKRLDIPTDNIQFEVSGMKSVWSDSHNAMQPMNSLSGWRTDAGYYQNGENMYVKDAELWIHTGNYYATLYNGSVWGPPVDQYEHTDTRRMYYITVKRL